MPKSQRKITPDRVVDPNLIESLGYSVPSGSFKQLKIGPHLLPFTNDGSTYTTDASGGINLGTPGRLLALYNNSDSLASVVISPAAAAILAAGVTDSAQNVGIPCMPNAWTYLSCADSTYVITSASTLLVFLIDDDTYLGAGTQG